jgi:SpoVK/Ycf46/Vps4 family AAA+-type ATPase
VDNKEQKRLTKIVEKEEKRLKDVMSTSNIQKAGLRETYELNSFVKMMRGPFNKLESASGISSDYFYGMPSNDLYNAARSDNYRIFVMGKPRSGKTTIAKSISKQLDLVHINIENWISSVFEKKKAKEAE